MITLSNRILSLGLLAILACAPAALAQDLKQAARDVVAKNQDALVSVSAVVKLDAGGTGLGARLGNLAEARESNTAGLVIDPSGLTVVSLAALNPIERMVDSITVRVAASGEAVKLKSEMSRLQMRLADGTEVPARVVFKDKEQDIAFVAPDPKEGDKLPQFKSVKLAEGVTAKELDDVVALSRHGKQFGYQPIVTVGHVTAIITKPRPMVDVNANVAAGSVVFLPDGRVLGIVILPKTSEAAAEMMVIPASEIVPLAEQAKKAAEKGGEKE